MASCYSLVTCDATVQMYAVSGSLRDVQDNSASSDRQSGFQLRSLKYLMLYLTLSALAAMGRRFWRAVLAFLTDRTVLAISVLTCHESCCADSDLSAREIARNRQTTRSFPVELRLKTAMCFPKRSCTLFASMSSCTNMMTIIG